jgi:hypothetical protein
MLALVALVAQVGEEAHADETIVPWSPFAYAAIAFVIFMGSLFAVTRLNIDR